MKKLLLICVCFLFMFAPAQTLKGGVSEEYIPKGFFGSWGVISKMQSATDPLKFNYESRDIWMLSGYSNVLILQNLESGAYSEIEIKDKSIEGKTLKFERKKSLRTKEGNQIHKEVVEFKLSGNNFSGTDKFTIENYDKNNKFKNADCATYAIAGTRISGSEKY
ncbi:MAG: hypothetical protein IJ877_02210 [Candidatus Gastranaerophilales bacterium]|nr:hypothetical protein [Candidatus Gastranaerophilales bacterium]